MLKAMHTASAAPNSRDFSCLVHVQVGAHSHCVSHLQPLEQRSQARF